MPRPNLALALLNVLGGIAVLGSYVAAFTGSADFKDGLWGGVPESLRPVYTVNMLLAAGGYFPFTWLFVRKTTPAEFRAVTGAPYALLFALYAMVLIASALWLPMTARMIASPDPQLWFEIRFVLALVGLGAAGILLVAFRYAARRGGAASWAAALGAIPFFVQTALLDALVWPAFFPR
jgi:hypothetical protein